MRALLAQARTGHAGLFWFAALMAGLAVVAATGVAVVLTLVRRHHGITGVAPSSP